MLFVVLMQIFKSVLPFSICWFGVSQVLTLHCAGVCSFLLPLLAPCFFLCLQPLLLLAYLLLSCLSALHLFSLSFFANILTKAASVAIELPTQSDIS